MTFKEIIEKLRGSGEEKDDLKDYIKELDKRTRAEEIVTNRRKSANLRELERDYKEVEEEKIKQALEIMRKKRSEDINFAHNPINTKNIMKKRKGDWEIMKERNLFTNERNIFRNQKKLFTR